MAAMDELDMVKKILTKSIAYVCKHLDPTPLLITLQTEEALTYDDVQLIECEKTTSAKSAKLLSILRHKETSAYDVFMNALKEEHRQIYDKIGVIEKDVRYTRHGADTTPSTNTSSAGASVGSSGTKLDGIAKDSDMTDFVEELTSNQLSFVYEKLHIPHTKVVKAQEKADTRDPDLKAKEVLRYWQQINAENATRRRLLQALEDCNLNLAKMTLETKWGNS